jgi:PTS system cellobiose-specific IIB component
VTTKDATVVSISEEEAMTRVIVVCAAGASSTFLARKLSSLAAESGWNWDVTPAPLETLSVSADAVVAISSHVVTPSLLKSFTERGIRHVILPKHVNGIFGADDALSAIAEFLGEDSGRTVSNVETSILEETR